MAFFLFAQFVPSSSLVALRTYLNLQGASELYRALLRLAQFASWFNGKPQASATGDTDACGLPLNEPMPTACGIGSLVTRHPSGILPGSWQQ